MSSRIVPWETLRIATRDMDMAQAIAQIILIGRNYSGTLGTDHPEDFINFYQYLTNL